MGAALVLQGARSKTDCIDISCSEKTFNNFLSCGYSVEDSKSEYRKICIDPFTVYEKWPVNEVMQIEGINVASLQSIANDKRKLGRRKDFEDIANIEPTTVSNVQFFEVFSYPNFLRGLLHRGNTDKVFVIVHGYFSSNKIGPNSLYVKICNAINIKGHSVLRIDLSGMGESEGDFQTLTFNQHLSDLYAVITKLKKCGYKKIGIIAHCEGCFPAVKMLDYFPFIDSLTLISPVFASQNTMEYFFGKAGYNDLFTNGQAYRKGLLCKKEFFDLDYLFFNNEYIEKIQNIKPLLIIAGKDEFADNDKVIQWAKQYGIAYEVIPNADHNYRYNDDRNQLIDYILNKLD